MERGSDAYSMECIVSAGECLEVFMEEIKPKRKANTQVTGEHAPSARRAGRTDKNQQNGNAAARKNNKRRAPRSTAA